MFLNTKDYEELCKLIGYQFKNELLLQRAITRKSGFLELRQEEHVGHNEQLEFLGDSLLRTVIDDILIDLYPSWEEEQLSKKRDDLVANNGKGVLLQIAITIDLYRFIIMGNGEFKNFQGNGKNKILSDVTEAIIGAIFIDNNKNYQMLKAFIVKHCSLQELYDKFLIEAILKENVNRVNLLLKEGANPNATGAATIFSHSIDVSFIENKQTGKKQWVEKQWGEGPVTLSCSGYEGATALQLAIVSKLVVPPIVLKRTMPSPGRNAFMYNKICYATPLKLLSKNPTLQDIFSTLSPIIATIRLKEPSLQEMEEICFSFSCDDRSHEPPLSVGQNLILEPEQPGYQTLQKFFESDISPNCLQILQLLLHHGADPNKKTWRKETALHTAASLSNTEAIELLLRFKADVTITDSCGKTPAEIAKSSTIRRLLHTSAEKEQERQEKLRREQERQTTLQKQQEAFSWMQEQHNSYYMQEKNTTAFSTRQEQQKASHCGLEQQNHWCVLL